MAADTFAAHTPAVDKTAAVCLAEPAADRDYSIAEVQAAGNMAAVHTSQAEHIPAGDCFAAGIGFASRSTAAAWAAAD